jgi:cell wall assembly regulator SMI1
MGFLTKKWNELVYTLTSNDRYAGYHSSKAVKSLTTNNINDNDISDSNDDNDDIINSNDNTIYENKYAKFKIDDSNYSVDEKQQAQLVLDAWHIIEDVINLDLNNPESNHFNLNNNNYEFDDELDAIDDIPDAEDFINSLSSPCTLKDLQVAQKHLDVKLPYPVIQYFLIHDGQEIAPSSTRKLGIMYGLQLLSLAEVITMTNYWRRVARKESNAKFNHKKTASVATTTTINTVQTEDSIIGNDPNFKIAEKISKINEKDLQNYPDLVRNMSRHSKNDYIKKLPKQKSFPENKIKSQYANSNWIPLVTDNTGNHIAIDLDPDVDGKIGQVIIFGREFDTKYVIADNWGQFMNMFALDFENPKKCKLDYDSDLGQFDLVYLDKNSNIVDQGYLYALSQRAMGKDI